MSPEQIAGLSITLIVMLVGLAGSVLPGVPSTPLVMIAAVGHRLYFRETSAGTVILLILLVLMLFSLLTDYLATMYGARRLGATWRGVVGAVIGAVIGIFFSLPGVILGPFLGAMVFEMIGGRELRSAARAGLGAFIGLLGGAVVKLATCVAMIALFAVDVIHRSTTAKAPLEVAVRWIGA